MFPDTKIQILPYFNISELTMDFSIAVAQVAVMKHFFCLHTASKFAELM